MSSSKTLDQAPIRLKAAFGFGAVAYGIKNHGFDYLLLLFYGTVVGLEPGLVGLALLIALCIDALSDPLVGYWSDNFRSRWGRRHPFMYAAAIPVAMSYFLLWNPPEWSETGLFFFLTGVAIVIRTAITFYETPSSALIPEITTNYEERTSLQAYRMFFGWSGGSVMSLLMFGVLLTGPLGILDRDAYRTYGIIASILIFIAIMLSAIGTHNQIPKLHSPTTRTERLSVKQIFREMFETLSERSFISLFISTVIFAVASGLTASLAFLMLSYFWGFTEVQIFVWTCTAFASAAMGFVVAPWATRKLGKKRAAITLGTLAFTIQPVPIFLRLADVFPENGDPLLFPLVLLINVFDLALIIAVNTVVYSMIADLVESNQLRTGRRSEGVYYASITFTRKTTQGLGVLSAGLILSGIGFPKGVAADAVDPAILWNLGAIYAPSLLVLWLSGLWFISRYKIDKQGHEDNLRKLTGSQ